MAWFALGVALTWLLEPVFIATGPLVLLALGAADTRTAPAPPVSTRGRRLVQGVAIAVVVGLGAFGAGRLTLAAVEVKKAETEVSLDAIHHAQALFPRDPALTDTASQILLTFMEVGPTEELAQQLLTSAGRTVELDDQQSLWWNRLAIAEFAYGSTLDEDRTMTTADALQRAYDRNPWSLMTLQNLHAFVVEMGDAAGVERWSAALCQIDACPSGWPA